MDLFTLGNVITLGCVALILFIYRQFDRHNRSLDRVRKYADKLKEDLAVFVEEREAAVRDYGLSLKVEQDAAKELMNRIKTAGLEMAEKAGTISRIEEQLNSYDSSLDELVRMTARAQENLNRIRDESAFVETANKRVGEAKTKLESMEKGLADLEFRFERENSGALERTAEAVTAAVRSTVSDLAAAAEAIERQVEDHREAVNELERNRGAAMARDMEIINKALKEVTERAAARSDKMEDAALAKLREQAQERVQKVHAALEEKLKGYQENARERVAELQNLFKAQKDEWKTRREEWKKDIQEQDAAFNEIKKAVIAETAAFKESFKDLEGRAGEAAASAETRLREAEARFGKTLEERGQKLLEQSGARLEEYRAAQEVQWKQLASLADDCAQLDGELRRSMRDTEDRVRKDFARFEDEAARERSRTAAEFGSSVKALKTDMDGVEQELAALKTRAYDNVSEKLKGFEEDFFADLAKRGDDIENRLTEWQAALENRLETLAAAGAEERRALESSFTEEIKKRQGEQQERLFAGLEQLKTETAAFEEAIRTQLKIADESLESFREQLNRSLEDARDTAEHSIKAELGRTALSAADSLKQNQRDLDARLKEIAAEAEARGGEVSALMEASRKDLEKWQGGFTGQLRELDLSMDEARRRARDLVTENDERLAAVRSAIKEVHDDADAQRQEIFARTGEEAKALEAAIKEADRHIKEFIAQTKLFEQADGLKLELERRIEDLRADMDRLDQKRAEASLLEGQFVKIRRLEDEVNNKMTRFLSEQHRIEKMEADFNRLLLTSRAVEEKLVQVSSSDDTLQAVQVEIRRLNDVITETEEKYQRLEKKKQALDTTTDGVDRNFRALQESEKALAAVNGDLKGLAGEIGGLRSDIEKLAEQNEKAREAADKISTLDESLAAIEERIKAVQTARQWLANLETRLEELNKEAQSKLKLAGGIMKKEDGKAAPQDKGAPPPGVREDIVKLARQGWTAGEISKAMQISRGAVELVLETAPRE
jgi:DNA repair exonuclease SbcCD ATPase subunit